MIKAKRMRKRVGIGFGFALVLVFAIGPYIRMVLASFMTVEEFHALPIRYWPSVFTLRNYQKIFADPSFVRSLINSFRAGFITTAVTMVLSVPAGYCLAVNRFPGRKTLLILMLGFQFVPPVVLCVPIYIMFSRLGLLNSVLWLSLAYPAFTIPFVVWLLTGFFAGVPSDLEAAAKIDGCSRLQAILYVIIPVAVPGILSAALYTFIWVWQEYLLAVIMLIRPREQTAPISLSFFTGQMGIDWTGMLAASVVFSLPIFPVTYFARYFQQGLSATGFKD
jgi:ABC-type glycerol-3-phosphate transport system permease component